MRNVANILLVDDRPDGLLALEVVLRGPQYNLLKARSGEQALEVLLSNEVAVILMDVQMPGMDGFETASLIKSHVQFKDIPIIFVTGIHGDQRFINQGYETGAIDYVLKPFEPSILRSKVSVLVDLYLKTKTIAELQRQRHERQLAETRKELVDGFRVRERRLSALVENSSDLIAILSRTQLVTYLNAAGRSLVGLPMEKEVFGRPVLDFFPKEEHERFTKDIIPKILREGKCEDEVWLRNFSTGALIPVWFRGFAIADPDTGEVDSIATVSRDMTGKKEDKRALTASEERFRTLTDCAPAGIFFADSEGRCELTNKLWEQLIGMKGEQTQAEGWFSAVHPEDRERVKQAWRIATVAGEEFALEHRLLPKNGPVRWVQNRAVPLRGEHGQIQGYLGSLVDITGRMESEEALRYAAEQLTRSNAELQQFAWVASHDLKEPLRTVSNYVRLLERRCRDSFDDESRQYFQYIVDSATQMYRLLNDLMTLTGVTSDPPNLKQVSCEDIFDKVISNIQVSIRESGAAVTRGELPTLYGNASQLGQVFQNLLSNAIKFRKDEPPVVRMEAERVDSEWRFVVRDNGIGIESDYTSKIFGVFQRLHSREKYPGTGAGLAICKKILERHGGRIWVESTLGRGSAFFFTLPAEPLSIESPPHGERRVYSGRETVWVAT